MKRYGLIGFPLSHSFSQKYFSEKFRKESIRDAVYENFPIESISGLDKILQDHPDICGLNVTIPYKKQVIPYLDDTSHLPLNACNCIRIKDGLKIGYNTDVTGFEISLKKYLQSYHQRALVMGKGGAGEAVQYVLTKLGIVFLVVGRRPGAGVDLLYEDLDEDIMQRHLLIINTTPVGMYPHESELPAIPYEFIGPRHYLFDLIYNPEKTGFLKRGEERGAQIQNGSEMLVIQAEESWKIWNQ